MYGSVPGVFKRPEASMLCAAGYQAEDMKVWVTMWKEVEGIMWYKPVCEDDFEEAIADGYKKHEPKSSFRWWVWG